MSEYMFVFSVGVLLGAAVFWSGYFCAMRKTKNKWNVKKTDDLYANSAAIKMPFDISKLKSCANLTSSVYEPSDEELEDFCANPTFPTVKQTGENLLKSCPHLEMLDVSEWDTWRTQDSTEPGE
jgi:hypothetical protein